MSSDIYNNDDINSKNLPIQTPYFNTHKLKKKNLWNTVYHQSNFDNTTNCNSNDYEHDHTNTFNENEFNDTDSPNA